jgi:uncharacterized protein YxjI
MNENAFADSRYLIRKKVLTLLGAKFHIYDSAGHLAFFSKMKAFKLKEDIRLYRDESMAEELLLIQARQIIDFSAAYDVRDPKTGEKVGALKRKGLKSILKDEWIVLDAADREIGLIQEDSMVLALIRRLLTNLIPQRYQAVVGGQPVCAYKQNFNPFVTKISVEFTPGTEAAYDRRLGIAAGVLLCAIEGKQQ